jgi:hypothetical protein
MKRLGLILALCMPLLALNPVEATAQECKGYCDGCYDPWGGQGHFFIDLWPFQLGNEFHPCGNQPECATGGHEYCSGFTSLSPDLTPESLQELGANELYALLGGLDGRVVYNRERRAIQLQACDDPSLVVVSVPLRSGQLDEFQAMLVSETILWWMPADD